MKIFTNKRLFKKILIVLIAIILFSAVVPPKVAYADDSIVSTVGGALLSPIGSLIIGIGDVLINIVHKAIYDLDQAQITVSTHTDWWKIVVTIAVFVAVAAAIFFGLVYGGAAIVAWLSTKGILAAGATLGVSSILTIASASIWGGGFVAYQAWAEWFGDYYVFPAYSVTPEEIFKGEVKLLDINFFDPIVEKEKYYEKGNSAYRSLSFDLLKMIDIGKSYDPMTEEEPEVDINEVGGNRNWEVLDINSYETPDIESWYYEYEYSGLETGTVPLKDYYDSITNKTEKKKLDSLLKSMSIDPSNITNEYNIRIEVILTPAESFNFTVNDEENDIKYHYRGYHSFDAMIHKYGSGEMISYYQSVIIYREVAERTL